MEAPEHNAAFRADCAISRSIDSALGEARASCSNSRFINSAAITVVTVPYLRYPARRHFLRRVTTQLGTLKSVEKCSGSDRRSLNKRETMLRVSRLVRARALSFMVMKVQIFHLSRALRARQPEVRARERCARTHEHPTKRRSIGRRFAFTVRQSASRPCPR